MVVTGESGGEDLQRGVRSFVSAPGKRAVVGCTCG